MRKARQLVALVAVAIALIVGAAGWLGYSASGQFRELAFQFYARGAERQFQSVVDGEIWRRHRNVVVDAATDMTRSKSLAAAIKSGDDGDLQGALNEIRNSGAIGLGEIDARAVVILDEELATLASFRAEGVHAAPDWFWRRVSGREGADRRRPFVEVWYDDDTPLLGVVVPVGGLRTVGYLVLHADPLHGMNAIDSMLAAHVTLLGRETGRELARYHDHEFAAEAILQEHAANLLDPNGEIFVAYQVEFDTSTLTAAIAEIEAWAIAVFGAIGLLVGGGAVLFLARFAFRAEAEEMAAQEAERRRRQEDIERQEAERVGKLREEQDRLRLIEEQKHALASELEDGVGARIREASELARRMQDSARQAGEAAEYGNRLVTGARHKSDDTVTRVGELTKISEQLQSAIQEIAMQSTAILDAAGAARSDSADAQSSIDELRTSIKDIGDVATMITDIADRTNLLALNATIEAARAGPAGRGFAVVANEVKSLAAQTNDATAQIVERQRRIVDVTGSIIAAIERIASRTEEIDGSLLHVSSAIEEQTAATSDAARSIKTAADNAADLAASQIEAQDASLRAQSAASEVDSRVVELTDSISQLSNVTTGVVGRLRVHSA